MKDASSPASIRSTFHSGTSVNLFASTAPEGPDPTTMKSNTSVCLIFSLPVNDQKIYEIKSIYTIQAERRLLDIYKPDKTFYILFNFKRLF